MHGVVCADSHVTEPADLWLERLDRSDRDRAPHVERNRRNLPAHRDSMMQRRGDSLFGITTGARGADYVRTLIWEGKVAQPLSRSCPALRWRKPR
jgi:hypothetical protein